MMASQPSFFLPVAVLKKVFRGKFIEPQQAFQSGSLTFHGSLKPLEAEGFRRAHRQTYRNEWIVYCKTAVRGAEHVLDSSAATRTVAISNHRLIAMADGKVTFPLRDSAHHNKKRLMTLSIEEFLRPLPAACPARGFVRIRTLHSQTRNPPATARAAS